MGYAIKVAKSFVMNGKYYQAGVYIGHNEPVVNLIDANLYKYRIAVVYAIKSLIKNASEKINDDNFQIVNIEVKEV